MTAVIGLALAGTACDPTSSPTTLIFDGAGTSESDYQALAAILSSHGIGSTTVNSSQLAALSPAALAKYQLIIWPGGDSIAQNNSLDAATRERVREAVTVAGVSYAGFCAGAFIAVGPPPATGGTPKWGLSIIDDDYVQAYSPNGPGAPLPVAAMVEIGFPDGTSRDLVWWDGPFLPQIPSGVIAKYPDHSPAMIEQEAGKGFVVLTGVHPEAPQAWRDEQKLVDMDGLDTDVAWKLIQAALTRTRLPAF
jgi:hypothetical protein